MNLLNIVEIIFPLAMISLTVLYFRFLPSVFKKITKEVRIISSSLLFLCFLFLYLSFVYFLTPFTLLGNMLGISAIFTAALNEKKDKDNLIFFLDLYYLAFFDCLWIYKL